MERALPEETRARSASLQARMIKLLADISVIGVAIAYQIINYNI